MLVLLSVVKEFQAIIRTKKQIVERSPDFLTVILQSFTVLLFSVFSVAKGIIEINKAPQATPKEFLFSVAKVEEDRVGRLVQNFFGL